MLFLEERHHSKGMDMVGYSRDGKASNLLVTDSTLISIRKQGDGSIIITKGASAGVYAVMRDATGKTLITCILIQNFGTRREAFEQEI
jgi:hypothetical protein